jgi:DNA-binding protein H-NS
MAQIELDALSLDELKRLAKDVAKAITGFEERRRQEARAAIDAKAQEFGFNLADLFDGAPARKPRGRAASAPKFRHPDNAALTWSGRGRQPQWIKDAIAASGSADHLRIG